MIASMVFSLKRDLNLVTNIPAAEKARSASMEVGGRVKIVSFIQSHNERQLMKRTSHPHTLMHTFIMFVFTFANSSIINHQTCRRTNAWMDKFSFTSASLQHKITEKAK